MFNHFQFRPARWLWPILIGALLLAIGGPPLVANGLTVGHPDLSTDTGQPGQNRFWHGIPAQVVLTDTTSLDAEQARLGGDLQDVPPGYMLIEGDILIRTADYQAYTAERARALAAGATPQPLGTFIQSGFWPGGNIAYEFDANVSTANRTIFRTAMDDWEAVANVTFTQCTNNNCSGNYIHVQSSATANNSSVGMIGGEQIINIYNWDWEYIQVHELGHALGFWHEQSRTDRDTYVTINWANITSGDDDNFQLETGSGRYGPYDFDSVMHYGRDDFSSNGEDTITVKNPWNATWQDQIGQRDHLSDMDMLTMSFLYPESNWRFANGNYTGATESGTFLAPAKTLAKGVTLTPAGGTLWIQPDTYSAVGTYNKAMTWQAPLGDVVLH